MLTGMLAELKTDLQKELVALKERPIMKQITAPEEFSALAQIKTLLDKDAESEMKAGETDIRL